MPYLIDLIISPHLSRDIRRVIAFLSASQHFSHSRTNMQPPISNMTVFNYQTITPNATEILDAESLYLSKVSAGSSP
jgi:hypothetical protein